MHTITPHFLLSVKKKANKREKIFFSNFFMQAHKMVGFLAHDERRLTYSVGKSRWFVSDLLTELALENHDTTLVILTPYFMKMRVDDKLIRIWSFDRTGSLFAVASRKRMKRFQGMVLYPDKTIFLSTRMFVDAITDVLE